MKKSFMNNIRNFVDSNVRHRIDKSTNSSNNEFFGDDLLIVERQFEDIRNVFIEADRRISSLLQSIQQSSLGAYTHNVQAGFNNLSTQFGAQSSSTSKNTLNLTASSSGCNAPNCEQLQSSAIYKSKSNTITTQSSDSVSNSNGSSINTNAPVDNVSDLKNVLNVKYRKLPIVGFLKFLVRSCNKLRQDSLLATTFSHCSQLQTQLTNLYLNYEQTIEAHCLKPIQTVLEIDIPTVIKLRKSFVKSHNDLEHVKAKYNGVSQKQQQLQANQYHTSTSYTITQSNAQQANTIKLDQLKKELDEVVTKFEQARDTYATELYAFVCRESEFVDLFKSYYIYQAEYHQQVGDTIRNSLPPLEYSISTTKRKVVFGTALQEHLGCVNRDISLVIEVCIHLLHSNGLNEEGLFRIPGSSLRIKKLKNAINAWFITLASSSELENEEKGQASIVAILELFKEILGQRQSIHDYYHNHQQQQTVADSINSLTTSPSPTAISAAITTTTSSPSPTAITMTEKNEPTPFIINSTTNSLDQQAAAATTLSSNKQMLMLDLHSIAGLLKLYLRELPEHLFSYALYESWIEATIKTANNEDRLEAYKQVLEQLPRANYDNLRYLIRFLHLLTCHQNLNKMTATNLAITMAPSLIWIPPVSQSTMNDGSNVNNVNENDDFQSLNIQMSNVGVSTTLHSLVIETLVDNAESLFSGHIEFNLPDSIKTAATTMTSKNRFNSDQVFNRHDNNRSMITSSPTCLSTASSSSFSSASSSSASVKSLDNNKDLCNKESGSIDGISSNGTNETSPIPQPLATQQIDTPNRIRPVSVYLQQSSSLTSSPSSIHRKQPPPIPPAPKFRSHYNASKLNTNANYQVETHNNQKPTITTSPKITQSTPL